VRTPDGKVLIGAGVAVVLLDEVSVATLLGVAAARDEVHGEPTARKVVERSELAGCHGGCTKARPMRHQERQPFGVARGERRNL
jgi:hypothetical protein